MIYESLPVRLRTLREQSSIALAALADSIGSTKGYLSHIEAGTRTPSLEFVEKLCAFFGVNRKWLLTGEGEQFARLDERETRERLDTLIASALAAGSEGEMRKRKVVAEITLRLEQLRFLNKATWQLYRAQILDLIDDYAAFCFEHYGELKVAAHKAGRAISSGTKTAPKKPRRAPKIQK